MMIKRVGYACEKCGRYYFSAESCKECEATHIAPVKVKSPYYGDNHDGSYKYPRTIQVVMADGSVHTYKDV